MRLVLGAALAAALLAGCGETYEADISGIERHIARDFREQSGVRVTIDCPNSIDWEPGEEFHCFAERSGENIARITVSMENDDGEWSWLAG